MKKYSLLSCTIYTNCIHIDDLSPILISQTLRSASFPPGEAIFAAHFL